MKASSFAKDKQFFCDPAKLLPLARFLPQPKKPKTAGKVGKPAGRGGYVTGYLNLKRFFRVFKLF